jgi:predicted GNAT family acetyltransferase
MATKNSLTFQQFSNPASFLSHAQGFLEGREAANSLILGVALRLQERPDWVDTRPYLAAVRESEDQPLLIAVMTPPNNLILAGLPKPQPDAFELLISELRAGEWPVTGVNAENDLAQEFIAAWTKASGQLAQIHVRLRLYELRQVISPPTPPGFLRQAQMNDLELLAHWREAFTREALREQPPANNMALVERMIQAGAMFVWDDHGPVTCAGSSRPTPHGISIGAVYTPPEQRRRGYATACVAALSQRLLNSGRQFCTLFTDLDYPTSNAIYQKIGYQPVCDFSDYRFSAA